MMQGLLADRFGLAVRREMKDMPIYAIVVARKDGKLGPKLTPTPEGGCVPVRPPEPAAPPRSNCGNLRLGPNLLMGSGADINMVAPLMSRLLGRTVVDRTGLTGAYDIHAEWTPDPGQPLQNAPGPPSGDRPAETGPSIFTAFQEQLGLKIESTKGPVEMLIVEKAERPTEN